VEKRDRLSSDPGRPQLLRLSFAGHAFELTQLTTASGLAPAPRVFHGEGTGRLDGAPGYRVTFTLTDGGDRNGSGAGLDRAEVKLRNPAGALILQAQGPLTSGNQFSRSGP
jgi:hypothetical protein